MLMKDLIINIIYVKNELKEGKTCTGIEILL